MGLLVSGNYSKTFNRGDNDPANGGASFRRVIAANSADVDTISGATLTSEAYIRSLGTALQQAGAAGA